MVHQLTWMNKQKTALMASWILLFAVILIGIFLLTDPERDVLSATVYSQQGSPQLGSFDPSLTPSTTPTPGVGSITPTPSGGSIAMPPIAAGKVTQQVDWVYADVGRCWSAWSGDQCSYTPHEGGADLVNRDLDGDGASDVACSLGTGARRKTTITNTSSKTFEVSCELYHCAACESANGTHAQCDGGLDEGALRVSQKISLTPGCSLTCSWSGVEGSCQSAPTPILGVGSPTPTPLPVTENIKSLRVLFKEIEGKVFVPAAILEAVAKIEMSTTFTYTPAQISQYTTPGNKIPGCGPNVCSATGPMQMTIGKDANGDTTCPGCGVGFCPNAWSGYKNAVKDFGDYTHTSNVCNLRDNIYGSAAKLKHDSGTGETSLNWTKAQTKEAGYRYYGNNTIRYPRLENMTYDEYVWWYYQNYGY